MHLFFFSTIALEEMIHSSVDFWSLEAISSIQQQVLWFCLAQLLNRWLIIVDCSAFMAQEWLQR